MPTADAATQHLEDSLCAAERCQAAVSHALLQGEPDLLQAAATEMQRAAQQVSALLQRAHGAATEPALRLRLHAVAQAMAMQREACVRRLAVVQRSLHSIIPSTRPSTYGGVVGAYARGSQGGAFKPFF